MDGVTKIARVGKVGRMGLLPLPLAPSPKRGGGRGVTGGGVEQLDLTPEQLREVARRIGETRAKRVWRLMGKVQASVPELCTYDWLERRKLVFEFQSSQMGGRLIAGGAVVDFIISGLAADGLYVWRVQGEYWHKGPEVERKDEVQKRRLLHLRIGGVPVVAVVDLWEGDIYDRFPTVFVRAEYGMGLRS